MLSKDYFLAYDYSHFGIVSVDEESNDCCHWIVPSDYISISSPINNIIYAFKRQGDNEILEVFDVSENFKLLFSKEYPLDIYSKQKNIDWNGLPEETRNRLIKVEDIGSIHFFPYNEYHGNLGSGDYYDELHGFNELRDAFDDDPEAMWGRLD